MIFDNGLPVLPPWIFEKLTIINGYLSLKFKNLSTCFFQNKPSKVLIAYLIEQLLSVKFINVLNKHINTFQQLK